MGEEVVKESVPEEMNSKLSSGSAHWLEVGGWRREVKGTACAEPSREQVGMDLGRGVCVQRFSGQAVPRLGVRGCCAGAVRAHQIWLQPGSFGNILKSRSIDRLV